METKVLFFVYSVQYDNILYLQLQLKTAREKLGRPCDMCNNYEDQLQSVQDELKAEKMKIRSLERELVAEKQTIDAQKNYIEELEKSVKDSAVEAETEVFHYF